MLQFCLFLVLKRKIFHCTLYSSRLLCLEYPLHFLPLHHWIQLNVWWVCKCKRVEYGIKHFLQPWRKNPLWDPELQACLLQIEIKRFIESKLTCIFYTQFHSWCTCFLVLWIVLLYYLCLFFLHSRKWLSSTNLVDYTFQLWLQTLVWETHNLTAFPHKLF